MHRRTFVLATLLAATPLALDVRIATANPGAAKAAADQGPSAEDIADRVQSFYDKTKTFKAGFKQRYKVKAYGKVKNSKGEVAFKKPGQMSWRYHNNGNRVVSDGKKLKVYEKENNQMYEQSVEKSQYPAALAFLVGDGNLRKSFKLRKLDAKRMKYEGGWVLEGKPKDPTPAYQRMILYVDGKTHHVRRVLLLDAQGNVNRFTFYEPSVNTTIEPTEFAFTPPAGTKVVRP